MSSRHATRCRSAVACGLIAGALVLLAGCARDDRQTAPSEEAEGWSVTAWGLLYEVFPEVDALIAGQAAPAHTHVTALEGFTPMTEGTVEIVLRGAGREQVFRASEAVRPGIFNVELRPEAPGEYELAFRITSPAGEEEIGGGTVRVGSFEAPGGMLEAPTPQATSEGGEALRFLKEQQWRTEFATAWVQAGSLARAVDGLARVRPPAGGEAAITAPLDAVLRPEPWPYPGQRVKRGSPLFRLVPRVALDRSLAALEAEAAALETDLATASARLARLEELFALQATSRRELEEAQARVATLQARRTAAARDLEAARSAREGGGAGALTLHAPFAGEVSAVSASPGETVAAGAPLARLVRTTPLWLEVAVAPNGSREIVRDGVEGLVVAFAEGPPLRLDAGVRLVSVAPELDPATGTIAVLLEVPAADGLVLGTTVEAQILLAAESEGIVVPATALVDDGGVTVVYLQLSGESFVRQQVQVLARQGDLVMVAGILPGQRLVTRGGAAIRRASLMASGETEGHVH